MITVSAKVNDMELETYSIGGQLADNLIAQSLDLPPKAAKVKEMADLTVSTTPSYSTGMRRKTSCVSAVAAEPTSKVGTPPADGSSARSSMASRGPVRD